MKGKTEKQMAVDSAAKQALTLLKDSETRYRRLFETAQDGILILDALTGRITDVNPFLVAMLGYSHGEFLGKRLWEIGPFKDVPESRRAFLELQRKNSSATKTCLWRPRMEEPSRWNLSAMSIRSITPR